MRHRAVVAAASSRIMPPPWCLLLLLLHLTAAPSHCWRFAGAAADSSPASGAAAEALLDLDLTQFIAAAAPTSVQRQVTAAAAAATLHRALPATSPFADVWPAAAVTRTVGSPGRLPAGSGLALAVAVRPDSASGTLLAVRGPATGTGGARPLLLSVRYRLAGAGRLRVDIGVGGVTAGEGFSDYQPMFRLGESWLVFHAYLEPASGWVRVQFWCPGHQFWSSSSGSEQRLRLPAPALLDALQIQAGSSLHLLHDDEGDRFEGYVHRLAVLSPASRYSDRMQLKCAPRSVPQPRWRFARAAPSRPSAKPRPMAASGDDEPPAPLPPRATTPETLPTKSPPLTLWTEPPGPKPEDESDSEEQDDATTPPVMTPARDTLTVKGSRAEPSKDRMDAAPTLGSNCQLIAGKTVCSYQGTLMLTQLLLNLSSTPAPVTSRPAVQPTRNPEKSDTDQHVDLVDDLSDFFKASRSRSGGGGGPLIPQPPVATVTTRIRQPTSQQYAQLTTASSDRLYIGPTGYRGEKGDTGPPGPPGVCPQRCQLTDSEVRFQPSGVTGTVRPGELVIQGPKGDQGSPGPSGKAGATGPPGNCRPDQCGGGGAKGEPGERGPQGPSGARGERGTPGGRGPAGEKGEPGRAADMGASVRDLVRSELQLLDRTSKGEKGEPGSGCRAACGSSSGSGSNEGQAAAGSRRQASTGSTSVRVLKTYKAFAEIGYTFEEGTLVFTKDEKVLYLKIESRINQWIEVANYITKPKIQLGFPSTTTSPRMGSKAPQFFLPYVVTGKKIRLVALPIKLHGDLYYKSAYSILGADYACHDAATAAGLSKSYFKVFLNGQFNNLDTIVHASQRDDTPVVNFHGQQLFTSFNDMLSRGAWNKEVQLQDFGGRNLTEWRQHYGLTEILAWQGLRQWQRNTNMFSHDCEGFTNRDPSKQGYVTDLASGQLFQTREITCDTQQVVLCIEAFDENSSVTDPMDYRRRR